MMLSHNPIVEPFALAHATIVTGDKAGTILRNMTIVVGAAGRIEQVAPSIETSIPAEYHYLDGTGKIVMPGLINAHTHLFSQGKPLNPKLATPKAVHGRNRKTQRHNIAGIRRYDDPHAWRRGI